VKYRWMLGLAVLWAAGSVLATGGSPVQAQDMGGAFRVGASPPPQEVYTKVNLTEPYNIIAGFTIYPSLASPDLFYYVPKPRIARTAQGRLVFRLLNYAMAENRNQVGSADVAGGYLQFDVTMAPTPEEEKVIKQELLNPPKRFAPVRLQTSKFLTAAAVSVHPFNQSFGATAKPKNVRLAPIPIHNLKARARIPGILAGDKTDTDWYPANGDASGTTTFALNLSGPQANALYQAIMNPAAVEPFAVFFDGDMGGYIKCKAKLTVKVSEIFNYLQTQQGSSTRVERPGSAGVSIFGLFDIGGKESYSSLTENQRNNIDVTQILNTAIKIEGDLQGYDDTLFAMAKYATDQAMARFGQPIALDELMDPKHEMRDPGKPPGANPAPGWAYVASWYSYGLIGPGKNKGGKAYYGFYDQKTMNRANQANFTVDLDKQIAVTWQFSPSSSIFDDRIVQEIQQNGAQYAQKLALNDPFFEKLDVTYSANLDFAGGPFNKVVFTDIFKLKDGTNYSVPGLLLEAQDSLDQGRLIGAAPPANLRFGGLLQGNLYQGEVGAGAFNILNPSARRTALTARKWPTFSDGSQVKGITHRWKYTVYFRPSVTDNDFPPSWTSPEQTNSETVLVATIPPKVSVITVSADALSMGSVNTAVVQVWYTRSNGQKTAKSVKTRPGGPDRRLYFFDDEPKTNLACEYQYTLFYAGGRTYESGRRTNEGGIIVVFDPNDTGAPTGVPTVIDDNL
jgi:hypothetical protein